MSDTESDRKVILSLGAGLQSTALALMALKGALPGYPRPMAAVFAVYEHVRWLMGTLGDEIPIHIGVARSRSS
jgi:hypothetical protein